MVTMTKKTDERTGVMRIVLLRHGESVWNKENKFTGWTDVSLSSKGKKEAELAGKILKEKKYDFDMVFESILKRSTQTTDLVLKKLKKNKNSNIKRLRAWQLNERHYGALQGLNKAEMAKKYGEAQVHKWRRSYSIRPPALTKRDARYLESCKKKEIPKNKVPLTESLEDTFKRVVPYFKKEILPELKKGKKILISAHGNSLRSLVKYLDNVPDDKITELNIPTGVPLVYEFKFENDECMPIAHHYIGDSKSIEKAMDLVKKQGLKKTKNQ